MFVPLAEEGLVKGEIARLAAERYFKPLLATLPRPRALVLGCTHFPALKEVIAPVAGPDVVLVDSAETTAEAWRECCKQKGLLNDMPAARRSSWPRTRRTVLPMSAKYSWAARSIRAASK